MIERGHKPVVAGLTKAIEGGIDNWVFYLPAILWADRITAKITTGRTPFYLEGGRESLLPIDLDYPTWKGRSRMEGGSYVVGFFLLCPVATVTCPAFQACGR
jgi:hypothetical protein